MSGFSAILLGSAAGGGVPQWNCRCPVCRLAWEGDPRVTWRDQASLAVTVDGENWVLVDAPPDCRAQILRTPALRPRSGVRSSPLRAVILTGGDIDRIGGLLHLRERQAFTIHAPPEVLGEIEANAVFRVLDPALVRREPLRTGEALEILPGLVVEAFAVPGKVPLYREEDGADVAGMAAPAVALRFAARDRSLVYAPGCARIDGSLTSRLNAATTLLLDGTLFTDDEMIRDGAGGKTGRRMGHVPISGEGGSLEALRALALARRIYVHINNTNPVLVAGSPEARIAAEAGWEIGYDGMEIVP